MSRAASSYQVGGDHYKNRAIQPAHLSVSYDLGGFELAVVKYVTRWRQRGGVDDLRKAVHYCEWISEHADLLKRMRHAPDRLAMPNITADRYCRENQLDELESKAVTMICDWTMTLEKKCVLDAMIAILDLIHYQRLAAQE